ncbi:hypothetical protein [Streptomyces sp. AHA2]|uniref:hypothetical protein n=1 Tax=Streptomyces sp. AHA2 TaxID=3064526 RepID=UPI002FDF5192
MRRRAAVTLPAALRAVSPAGCCKDGGRGGEGLTAGVLPPSRAVPRRERADRPLPRKRLEKRPEELWAECTGMHACGTAQHRELADVREAGAAVGAGADAAVHGGLAAGRGGRRGHP